MLAGYRLHERLALTDDLGYAVAGSDGFFPNDTGAYHLITQVLCLMVIGYASWPATSIHSDQNPIVNSRERSVILVFHHSWNQTPESLSFKSFDSQFISSYSKQGAS